MINFHLLRIVGFKPFVFFNVVIDELYCQLSVYLDGSFSRFTVVEPGFSPPSDSAFVWVNTYHPRDVEALYINIQFGKGVNESALCYGFVFSFFFSSSDNVLRKI